jgi:dCMP deaminase
MDGLPRTGEAGGAGDADARRGLKDEVFLRMALELSRLGTCCRLKVGCVLLRTDGGIASGGYNGALPGMPHCTPDTCSPDRRCLHTSHAEENALGFCDGPVQTAYVTDEPCLTCTRALVRRGAKRIVFLRPYASMAQQERDERAAVWEFFRVEWEMFAGGGGWPGTEA